MAQAQLEPVSIRLSGPTNLWGQENVKGVSCAVCILNVGQNICMELKQHCKHVKEKKVFGKWLQSLLALPITDRIVLEKKNNIFATCAGIISGEVEMSE